MKFEEIKQLITFDAGYSRVGVVSIVGDTCVLCKEYTGCIHIDGSEGEYAGASVCGKCVTKELRRVDVLHAFAHITGGKVF